MKLARWMAMLSVSALLLFVTSPLFAEQVPWNGLLVESGQVPEETTSTPLQVLDSEIPAPPAEYGTQDWIAYSVGACDAYIRDSTHTAVSTNCVSIAPATLSSSTTIGFPLHLPNGASIGYVDIRYYDNDAANDPSIGLYYSSNDSNVYMESLSPITTSAGNSYQRFGLFSPAHTVSNMSRSYNILAILTNGASAYNRIYNFTIWYKLQISPAPIVATFSDVPTSHPFFREIEALADSGISTGYAGGLFKPGDYVTRQAMAAFLARALGLHYSF